jgi:predicted glycosyltransferase
LERKIRIFLYSQHLSGTGHFVRTYEIARALAKHHDVYLLDGGRSVPRPESEYPFSLLGLPQIYRAKDGIAPVDGSRNIDAVMEERKSILLEFINTQKPDVIMIEHFPFSKQMLASEIIPFIELGREVNAKTKVVCSLRDILVRSPRDPEPEQRRHNTLKYLHEYFDLILMHSDPALVQLQTHNPWASEIRVQVEYTGYVSEKPEKTGSDKLVNADNSVVVSAGGAGSLELITQCINAWKHPDLKAVTRDRKLIIFLPLFPDEEKYRLLNQLAGSDVYQFRHPGI